MKTTTVRMPPELDKELTDYAKAEDISKNQVIKKALRELFAKSQSEGRHNSK